MVVLSDAFKPEKESKPVKQEKKPAKKGAKSGDNKRNTGK